MKCDRLYMKRNVGGRGLLSVSECVESERRMLNHYLASSEENLLKYVAKEKGLVNGEVESKEDSKKKANEKKEAIREMKLHGQFEEETEEIKNRTQAALVGGLCGRRMLNHCAIPAPEVFVSCFVSSSCLEVLSS